MAVSEGSLRDTTSNVRKQGGRSTNIGQTDLIPTNILTMNSSWQSLLKWADYKTRKRNVKAVYEFKLFFSVHLPKILSCFFSYLPLNTDFADLLDCIFFFRAQGNTTTDRERKDER